jgi:muramoyltetrapeptide carboxypeptidase
MEHKATDATKPRGLKPGDTIGIVAPAGPFDPKQLDQGVAVLKSMGYAVKIPEDLGLADGFLAGPDTHRASLINSFFADSQVNGIVCARGGYGSMRILELLDYALIRKHAKVFVGFSDITALHAAIYNRCSLVTFHGPVVTYLGRADAETIQFFSNAVAASAAIRIVPKDAVIIRAGHVSGRVCGGNLATLCHLLGTRFAPDFKDCILLLEETNEAPYRVDRMLFQMQLAGCFEDVRGIALGSFHNCGDMDEIYGVVQRMFRDYNFPVMAGFDIGHGSTNLTLPLGLPATLDTAECSLTYTEPAINNLA